MSSYSPTIHAASVGENWKTVLLSLRDLRRHVPINLNSYPGIHLTTACYNDKRYTFDKSTCVSNLISVGYRRFVVDLYLNREEGTWGICPVSTGDLDSTPDDSAATTSSPPRSSSTIGASRLQTTSAGKNTNSSSIPALNQGGSRNLKTVSDYTCDSAYNTTFFLSIFSSWIQNTETNLGANLAFLIFNLHDDLKSVNTKNSPTPQSLSQILKDSIPSLYTPTQLSSDRANLNSSWFEVSQKHHVEYYSMERNSKGVLSTEEGWPNEKYLEFELRHRFIASFGEIPPGLDYDPSQNDDDTIIFPPGSLGTPVPLSGKVENCLFTGSLTSPNYDDSYTSTANASWKQFIDSGQRPFGKNSTVDSVRCGYSTIVNSSSAAADTTTEDRYIELLRDFYSWSWRYGQPANTSNFVDEDEENTFRCASMSAANGTWQTSSCGERKRAACRVGKTPYHWKLGDTGTYYDSSSRCPDNSTFDTPRSALENQYLLLAIREEGLHEEDDWIWLDFNSLAVEACWVTGGANASCPYESTNYGNRDVIVPTVAALIVLVVFAAMAVTKAGSWRVERSRRLRRKEGKRRVRDGVEYEGAPS